MAEPVQGGSMGPKRSPRSEMQGILRLDFNKPRRSSGGSVDFRVPERLDMQVEPPSPQPSVDRLSVSFRDRSDCSDASVTVNIFDPGSPPAVPLEMVTFRPTADQPCDVEEEDDDYSMSVTQILNRKESTRRASQRKRRRRPSSPFSHEGDSNGRRRSSVFTNSSAETAVSVEDGTTQEQIFENIRLHKEVLSSVKLQPWSVRRKIKLVKQAKKYVKKHEGELQERLAQSKSTRDIMARFNIVLVKKLQYCRRELANMMTQLIPWELRIKEIESHFGSAVASYFTFLRWMFWVNLVIAVVLACFIMIPEVLTADKKLAGERKRATPEEEPTSTYFLTLWDFEGFLKYSPIFYGFYTHKDRPGAGYRLPLAYFMAGLAVYVYSFVAILRRMAENSRMSKLSEKDDECAFTWKLFSGWDYMIGNAETAHNRVASIVLGFKESLLEETEKKKDETNWKVIGLRVLVNILVLGLLVVSAFIVFIVVERSTTPEADDTWWRQNEITVSLSIITMIFPIFFEVLGLLEGYHPRKCLRIQLARIMVLNLLNLYTLIFSQFWKISKMVKELQSLKPNATTTSMLGLAATTPETTIALTTVTPICHEVEVECATVAVTVATTLLTTTLLPILIRNTTTALSRSTINTTDFTTFGTTSSDFTTSTFDPFTSTTTEDPYASTFAYDEDDTAVYTSKQATSNTAITSNKPKSEISRDLLKLAIYTMALSPWKKQSTKRLKPEPMTATTESERELESLETTTAIIGRMMEISSTEDVNAASTTTEEPRKCYELVCEDPPKLTTEKIFRFGAKATTIAPTITDPEVRKKLTKLCWETMFGQELVKLTVMDLVMTVVSILIVDFLRAILVRLLNNCWCWDLEKQFPQYGDFKIAENILHLVNNQGMVWMGMFFSPGLPAINLIKLIVILYLRSWAVLTCNVPHEVVFRASRSNNFYLALLLTMLFLCVLPVGFAIVWIEPSWHCGPFSEKGRMYQIFTDYINKLLPSVLQKALEYVASPAIIIPLLMLLILIIYYLLSLTTSLREANADLKVQLRRERTEERRKMFQLVDKKNRKGSGDSDPFTKWKKILPEFSPKAEQKMENGAEKTVIDLLSGNKKNKARKELISRLLMRAVSSGTSDEENAMPEEATGTPSILPGSQIFAAQQSEKTTIMHEKPTWKDSKKSDAEAKAKHENVRRQSSTPPSSAQRSSIASDKIPVIRISKTESEENILSEKSSGQKIKGTSPKRRFREAVTKHIEVFRKQREEQRVLKKSLYTEKRKLIGKNKKTEEPVTKDTTVELLAENEAMCPIAKDESIPSELDHQVFA